MVPKRAFALRGRSSPPSKKRLASCKNFRLSFIVIILLNGARLEDSLKIIQVAGYRFFFSDTDFLFPVVVEAMAFEISLRTLGIRGAVTGSWQLAFKIEKTRHCRQDILSVLQGRCKKIKPHRRRTFSGDDVQVKTIPFKRNKKTPYRFGFRCAEKVFPKMNHLTQPVSTRADIFMGIRFSFRFAFYIN